jgi:hypothetical protein
MQCSGECTPTSKRCSGNTTQTCSATGMWTNGRPARRAPAPAASASPAPTG